MIRGTFQCWGTANDLIGHDDIEGCGAGGGVRALALAWDAQAEWRPAASEGPELRVHFLFNRRFRVPPEAAFARTGPIAAELWSDLPYRGRVRLLAHQPIRRLALRLPDGADPASARIRRSAPGSSASSPLPMDGPYVLIDAVIAGEQLELRFALRRYQTTERAAGVEYRVHWKGSAATGLEPPGLRVPLYRDRTNLLNPVAPLCAPRYP